MNSMKSMLTKLNSKTVKHIICSNPYNPAHLDDQDLLKIAVNQALHNIEKLSEACRCLHNPISEHVLQLKRSTEALLGCLEPSTEELNKKETPRSSASISEATPFRNQTVKPWRNPRGSAKTKSKRI
ncbi:hypothetical protein [Paenibacillus timonensis]|uniref:hypothetical protein n=1 Tax=Paenibacillus timonensis TaxID=225915 RepID=UPI0022E1C444|nr:hypothetical protein [Paenibacillus timonensis]